MKMSTEVLKSFGTLQLELEEAKSSLKGVDEHIKKLIGRDPSENQSRSGNLKRAAAAAASGNNNLRNQLYENDEPPNAKKRNNNECSVFKRLSARNNDEDATLIQQDTLNKNHHHHHHHQLISKVIVQPKEVPSRQDVLAAQGADKKSVARNRRMFGALLGTLQKFRQEETKLKPKEEKRAQLEKKLEQQQIREREELKKERQDLFLNRKRKQAEIRMIELKMTRMKEHAEWEEKQRPLMHFIQTKTKPHLYYIPRVLNDQNQTLLDQCKQNIEKMIDRKRQDVYEELNKIEERMKRNFSTNHQQNEDKDETTIIDDSIEEEEEIIVSIEPKETTTKMIEEATTEVDNHLIITQEEIHEIKSPEATQ